MSPLGNFLQISGDILVTAGDTFQKCLVKPVIYINMYLCILRCVVDFFHAYLHKLQCPVAGRGHWERDRGKGISNVIPALNHTLLLWLQDFVRRRWGKLDNLQKISLLWKLPRFYNLHMSCCLLQVGAGRVLVAGTPLFLPGDLGSWSWVLDRSLTARRSLISV